MAAIPVVDFALFVEDKAGPDIARKRLESLATINKACREFGLFQVINHGLDSLLLSKVLQNAHSFFELPLEYKCKFSTANNGMGFVHRSGAKGGPPDRKEHFMFAAEGKSTLWPDLVPSFRPDAVEVSKQMQKLCDNMMAILSQSLGSPDKTLRNCFDKNEDYYNFLHYPGCSDYQGQVLAPHQDGTIFTIVSQLNRVPGYQVLKDGTWHLVVPVENSLIINLGDIIQVWTNGLYKAAVHCVVANKKQRFSFVYHHVAEGKTRIAPLPEFVSDQPKYKSFLQEEYLKLRFENKRLGNNFEKNITIDYYLVD
ncbi:2-oxoacid-dependent dioxygenase [Selaginella moellendorffii]|uniref:2-oxoacid-dependent dioxygenase n=1 Tax=Selaginella moellendorffii TaxID=88036 RepID=D8SXC0_SELML|nr:2-oxoacid-dependent dioxygenase [Selaginella moellendorffii]